MVASQSRSVGTRENPLGRDGEGEKAVGLPETFPLSLLILGMQRKMVLGEFLESVGKGAQYFIHCLVYSLFCF